MHTLLREMLSSTLHRRFGAMPARWPREGDVIAVFSSPSEAVGDATVSLLGPGAVLVVGHFTHRHFECDSERLSEAERAEEVAAELSQFLDRLFADEIVFFGNATAGGFAERAVARRSWLARAVAGGRFHVWSGPLGDATGT